MRARGLGQGVVRGLGATLRTLLFLVLLHCRPLVKFVLRTSMAVGTLFVALGVALKLNVPMAAFVVNGVCVLGAALLSWKYDTLLMWLTPDRRRLILDV